MKTLTFDVRTYAPEHRLRVRNLHDGYAAPPVRRACKARRQSAGYVCDTDRADAIVCRYGCVDRDGWGPDRIGWYLCCRSRFGLTKLCRRLADTGAVVVQDGDTEAAGWAPLAALGAVLAVLRPYVRRGIPALALATGANLERSAARWG